MGLFKSKKKQVNLGEWKSKLEISIPTYDLEIKVFTLPFRIGNSPNNDLVLQDDSLDVFHGVILENNNIIQICNISPKNLLNLRNQKLRSFESVIIEKSTQVDFSKIQLMLMPELKIKHRKKIRQINIQCPYCGEILDLNHSCPICGFGNNRIKSKERSSRFENILKRVEKEIESPTLKRTIGGVKGVKLLFTFENGPAKGKTIEIPENSGEITIGRSIYNAVCLSFAKDPTMSRFHSKLFIEGNKVSILDNKSLNGTLINGELINQKKELNSEDLIQLGNSLIRIKIIREESYE